MFHEIIQITTNFKICRLITILNDTFAAIYDPSLNTSIDESMIRFKGHGTMKQYLPMKTIKRGLIDCCASCSCCEYLLLFQIYPGKESQRYRRLADRVVTNLVIPRFRNNNYVVYMDNFLTSIALLKELFENGILAGGTYRSNRTGLPVDPAECIVPS